MRTDSLFYSLFQTSPSIFFELLGQSAAAGEGYRFASVEVKQTAFRLDGVFLPPEDLPDSPVYFLEVQFQRDVLLYRRLFSEVFLYLRQYPSVQHWQAIAVYPHAAIEVKEMDAFGALLESRYVKVIYLDQLAPVAELPLGLGILRLIVEPEESVAVAAKSLIKRVQQVQPLPDADINRLVELIETIVVYTFPNRSRQEIATMLGLVDMKETRVYQEAHEEGREEGREEGTRSLLLRQLTRQLGELPESVQEQLNQLSIEELERLGEALLDFSAMPDLLLWLEQSPY